jgi:hypothetical protein
MMPESIDELVGRRSFGAVALADKALEGADGDGLVGTGKATVGVDPGNAAAAPRRHAASQGAPQMRPQIDANGFGPRAMR